MATTDQRRRPRPTSRELAREVGVVVADLPRFATAPLVRSWHRRWGATDEEVRAAMPGDELITGVAYLATRAITIDAPPEAVWPWLVQVGCNDTTAFKVAGFEENRWLLWQQPLSTWSWTLTELPGGRTRLVTRLRIHLDWSHKAISVFSMVLNEFGDFPMMRRMLIGIQQRAEAGAPR